MGRSLSGTRRRQDRRLCDGAAGFEARLSGRAVSDASGEGQTRTPTGTSGR